MQVQTVKLEIFIPETHVEPLRHALHEAGVGRIGQYDHCLSITPVTGYWRPLPGSDPHIGTVGEVSSGTEYKVEANCSVDLVNGALHAIKAVHPYDEPLINVIPLLNHLFGGETAVTP